MSANHLAICSGILVSGLVAVSPAKDNLMEKPINERVTDRTFPSIFQAWNPADNLREDPVVTAARHDLIFHGERFFGLKWDNAYPGLATNFTAASIRAGLLKRRELLSRNPNLILLMEIRYRDAHISFLPGGHPWWRRDSQGNIVPGWEEGRYSQLNFSDPEYREHVAAQARAAVESGVVDGIMLDWWGDDADRLALIKTIRMRMGESALILANANDRTTPRTGPYLNGYFMECTTTRTPTEWRRLADTLAWAEQNLRTPRINCLETWYHDSRRDEHLMRATTALSMVLSDGYCLFSDPNPLPTPDHLHDWYPFWNRKLGKGMGARVVRPDGVWTREFSNGLAAYNPMGNKTVTLIFDTPRVSGATGKSALAHSLPACDGDIYFSAAP
jgi:hypothetical protein